MNCEKNILKILLADYFRQMLNAAMISEEEFENAVVLLNAKTDSDNDELSCQFFLL